MDENDEKYDQVCRILMEAMKKINRANISDSDALPVLVDFATMVALTLGGEAYARAAIDQIDMRLHELKSVNLLAPTTTRTQ